MSEFTNNAKSRIEAVYNYSKELISGVNGVEALNRYNAVLQKVTPKDVIIAFDYLVKDNFEISSIKTVVSKVINILNQVIISYPAIKPRENSFLDILQKNNSVLDDLLKDTKTDIKNINSRNYDNALKEKLISKFEKLQKFEKQYVIKENILFPFIEKYFADYRCLHIMWSIHDDIRRNIKLILNCLQAGKFEIKEFNRLTGRIYFDMYAVKFRDEKLLFPVILENTIPDELDSHLNEAFELGFPYYSPEIEFQKNKKSYLHGPLIDLQTGNITVRQIISIFNHLPVDITFIDENDEVKYFSSPKERFFARSKAIIGRKVQNCHPKESVHVVNKIVEEFKTGTRDNASFWINIKGTFLLIKYFAVRDEKNNYIGTLEVSQNITEISQLKGEKRLLDWE